MCECILTSWILSTVSAARIFPGPTSFPMSHFWLCPCGWILMWLPVASAPIRTSWSCVPSHHSVALLLPSSIYPGAMMTFSIPNSKTSKCRQKIFKRQKLVQVSVKLMSYSSVSLRPLESNDDPTGLGLSLQSHISPDNWVKQLVIPIARTHEQDDKGRLIYGHLVSERCSILFNK